MIELIKISQAKIGDEEQYVVSARELHEKLAVKSRFNDWISNRLQKYEFIENTDFILVTKILVTNNPKNPHSIYIDYLLVIDVAKEFAMVENNEIGRSIRRYFITVEKEFKQYLFSPAQIPEPLTEKANCWGHIRTDGKKSRLTFTDSIQLFIKYAKSQGSKHSENYYNLFTENIYLKLGFLSSKKDLIQLKKMKKETGFNFRNVLSTKELSLISTVEITIAQIIIEEIEKETPYKEIFSIAQTQLIKYAEIIKPALPNSKDLLDFDKNLFLELE
jgi:anti-repressor protein